MEEKDKKAFLILTAMLAEAFKEEPTSERGKIYFEFLKPYPLNQVNYAIKQAIIELKWFPKVADLIEIINPCPYEYIGDKKALEKEEKEKDKKALEYIMRMAKIMSPEKRRLELEAQKKELGL